MKEYTVGFLFTADLKEMLFLHPKRPEWQVGFLNGPGGRIEEGESPAECIAREMAEEAGIEVDPFEWQLVETEIGARSADITVHFLSARFDGSKNEIVQLTDEALEWLPIDPPPENIIENLRELIPKAAELERQREIEHERTSELRISNEIKQKR
jgi:8-oxo-dGTP diphosphatase